MRWAGVIAIGLVPIGAAQANLIVNGSFEDVPGPVYREGILPSAWLQVSLVTPGADTYSNDGSYGLLPSYYGNFTGITAFDGIRWVAGWSWGPESFGQYLNTPLTAGRQYRLSAQLIQAKRLDLANPGGYRLLLADNTGLTTTVLLGTLAPTTGSAGWEPRTLTFTAPANAALLPLLVFQPYVSNPQVTSYPGLDSVSLDPTCEGPDGDGDGVCDADDQCPNTVPGAVVDGTGCPPLIPGDFNRDGDVDGNDFDLFEACATGPSVAGPPAGCTTEQFDKAEMDNDSDVDMNDFGIFQRCYSGTNRLANQNCAG